MVAKLSIWLEEAIQLLSGWGPHAPQAAPAGVAHRRGNTNGRPRLLQVAHPTHTGVGRHSFILLHGMTYHHTFNSLKAPLWYHGILWAAGSSSTVGCTMMSCPLGWGRAAEARIGRGNPKTMASAIAKAIAAKVAGWEPEGSAHGLPLG